MKKSNTETNEGKIIPIINRCDILIVEDEPLIRALIGKMIQNGFPSLKVQSAKDGLEGLEKVMALKPRIIWTCVKLPRMDGLRLIELIRQDPDLKNIRIIVSTGCYTMVDVIKRVVELGIDIFLPKPFKIEEILSAIAACLPQ